MRRQKLGVIGSNLNVNSETLGYNPSPEKGNTDHHSGLNQIDSGQSFTIETNKQMINWDGLTIDGDLNINGDLILN